MLLALLFARHAGEASVPPAIADTGAPRQIIVEIVGPSSPLTTITPQVTVRAQRSPEDEELVAFGVRVSTTPLVVSTFVQDTSVAATGETTIQLRTPLPSGATVYFRGYVRTAQGTTIYSPATQARVVPRWLTLISPGPGGGILEDRTPVFLWSQGPVAAPPGPWSYTITVMRTTGGPPVLNVATSDTAFFAVTPLEFNTSYRWTVTGQLVNKPEIRISESSSFVIVDQTTPRATLLHQPFPSPFPSPVRSAACVWFDLSEESPVTIDVLTIRTDLVKRIFVAPPGAPLDAGRYGRAVGSTSGCDSDFSWDGTNELGQRVRAGTYLIRLRAGRREFVKPIVFRG